MFSGSRLLVGIMLAASLLGACNSKSSSPAPAGNNPPVASQPEPQPDLSDMPEVMQHLKGPMADCLDRVWPNVAADYQTVQVLVTENHAEGDLAYLWSMNGNEEVIEKLDAETLGDEWFAAYNFGEFRGNTTLGFNVSQWHNTAGNLPDSLWDTSISTLYHEGFHLFGQKGWRYTPGNNNQEYPIRWEPRYLRAQLLFALQDSLLGQGDLAAAAYWYERYLSEYSEEAVNLSYVDRIEGSTRYVDTMMTALAENGCDATEEDLLADIRQHLPPIHYRLEGSGESYVLGLLAGLLLRENPVDLWHSRVEEGETLQGVLLDGVAPMPQTEDTELQTSIQSSAAQQNEYLDGIIGQTLEEYDSRDYYRLVFDSVNSLGSYELSGSYRLATHPQFTAIDLSASGAFSHGATIHLNNKNILGLDSSPCEGFYGLPAVVTLPKEAVDWHTDGTADLDTQAVKFSRLRLEEIIDGEHSWLCPLQ